MKENPTKILYKDREVNSEINRTSEEVFESKEITPETVNKFFGLGDASLTQEETEEFRLFVEYASKRLINANINSPIRGAKSKDEAVDMLTNFDKHIGDLAFHDISHAIVNYENKNDNNSIVPEFFKTEKRFNNKELIAEEPRALMFDSIVGKYPVFIAIMDEQRKKEWLEAFNERYQDQKKENMNKVNKMVSEVSQIALKHKDYSFESVFETYQNIIYAILRSVNNGLYKSSQNYKESEFAEIKVGFEKIVEDLKINPDPRLVSMAKSVFENYDKNPKILFQEFKRICDPLVANLKKRSTI